MQKFVIAAMLFLVTVATSVGAMAQAICLFAAGLGGRGSGHRRCQRRHRAAQAGA